MDIKLIPLDELYNDRAESVIDAKMCDLALLHGIYTYSNGESVERRRDANLGIIAKIDAELERRGLTIPAAV